MERKLASVQRVKGIESIPGADNIEIAVVGGWRTVIRKGAFQEGDLGVFLEIDSVPPDNSCFSFLWQKKTGADGVVPECIPRPTNYRLRTMKLRGALSQGLLLPPEDVFCHQAMKSFTQDMEGADLTELLCVMKYEPPTKNFQGQPKNSLANFPSFLHKTDEMRVQSAPEVLEEMQGLPYTITLKYDGTSATYAIDPSDDTFHVCSRNMTLKEEDNAYWRIARRYGIEEILRASPGYAVQGEICGPGIQGNRLGLKEADFFAFNVYDVANARYLDFFEARDFCDKSGVPNAQVVETGSSFGLSQDELLTLAEGKYEGTKNEREGIVIRPIREVYSPALRGRLSFKAVSNAFLTKGGD